MKQTRHRIPTKIREALKERCQGRCDIGGEPLGQIDAHHRKQRSVGGKDELSNLLAVCRRHHNLIHEAFLTALTKGWLVNSWEEPQGRQVLLFDGWVLLHEDGRVRHL